MLKKASLPFLAFLQASALVAYILLISLLMNYVFPKFADDTEDFYGPVIMLLLFIISAVICASIVLGRAGMLFMQKKLPQAYSLVAWTVGWGIVYFVTFVLLIASL